jgi:hypothetical protein
VRKGRGSVKESGSHVEVKTEGNLYEYESTEKDVEACLRREIK